MKDIFTALGFKKTDEKQWELSDTNNDNSKLSAIFITPAHDGDVALPGNENSQFPIVTINETTESGIYDITFSNGDNDKVVFKSADSEDFFVLMQALINETYQNQGYEIPYVFDLDPDTAIYSPFHGLDARDDDFITEGKDGDARILKSPEVTYPDYEHAKRTLAYHIESSVDEILFPEEPKTPSKSDSYTI